MTLGDVQKDIMTRYCFVLSWRGECEGRGTGMPSTGHVSPVVAVLR